MPISYENHRSPFVIFEKKSEHAPPHIHKHFECILLTAGTLELGIGTDLYHMEKGDFAVVFPDLIHHYQSFGKGRQRSVYILADPFFIGKESFLTAHQCPEDPVIKAAALHPDIPYAVKGLLKEHDVQGLDDVRSAYFQLILARALPLYQMIDKSEIGSNDIIYRTVDYMAHHFSEELTLTDMAHALGVSPYSLSRVFSQTFHTNFNRYLNNLRLERARQLLRCTDYSITDICFDCGFESQRTFNRAFHENFRVTPSDYRKNALAAEDMEEAEAGAKNPSVLSE